MLQVINGTELNKTSNSFIQISTLHIISFYPFNVMVQCIFVSSFKSRPHEDYFISYHIITFYETMASTCTSYTHSDQKRDVGGGGEGLTHPEEILLLCHLALDAVLHRPPSFHVHILLVVGQHL